MGFASGWMAIRGPKEENVDRGFVLSDHADWDGLVDVIKGTGAEIVKLPMEMVMRSVDSFLKKE